MTAFAVDIPSGWYTTAAWRAWSAAYSTAFGAVGLTRVVEGAAISSPAAFASISRPAAGAFGAFEIWRFDAPLTGASPVYLRVAYGCPWWDVRYPVMVVAVGDATDGSGLVTFAGVVQDPAHVVAASNAETGTKTSWISYDGHGLALAISIDSAAQPTSLLVVDRQRRPDGTAQPNPGWNNTGFMRFAYGGTTPVGRAVSFYDPVAQVVTNPNLAPAIAGRLVPTTTSMLNASLQLTAFPWSIVTRQGVYGSKMVVSLPILDANTSNDLSIPNLGATRVYRALGARLGTGDAPGQVGTGYAMWWED